MKRALKILGAIVVVAALAFHSRIAAGVRLIRVFRAERAAASACAPDTAGGPPVLRLLPTRYVADRWFATPVTTRGDTIIFFLDSGGGGTFVTKPVLQRLGYDPSFISFEEGDSLFTGGPFPAFVAGASIPPPRCSPGLIGFGTRMPDEMEGASGMLGHPWFGQRVWVLDYPARTMSVYDPPPAPHPFDAHTIPMTLKLPTKNFPRIRVVVDGDTISMLLDTGATSPLTAEAVRVIGDGPTIRASAFVSTRRWDRWRAAHPEWRVLPMGEASTRADMLEVPRLTIAGFEVGSVWFAKRGNSAYDDMMSPQMDQPVEASIGGVAFKSFRMTMDYPNQRVTFERTAAR